MRVEKILSTFENETTAATDSSPDIANSSPKTMEPGSPAGSPQNKQKKRRRRAKEERKPVPHVNNTTTNDEDDGNKPGVHRCGVCGNVFGTRNQLFKHIQKSGHAVYK